MNIVVVDREGREHVLEALEGWRVMEVIRDWGLPIKAECGGACACATCHVYVDEGWLNAFCPQRTRSTTVWTRRSPWSPIPACPARS